MHGSPADKAWREANREELLAYAKAYYRKNRDAQLAAAKQNYVENRDAKLAYAAQRYAENPEHYHAWKRNNPEKHLDAVRVRVNRRRAVKKNAPGDGVSQAQWKGIKEAYGNRCAYCGKMVARLTMDHVDSLVSGGSHDVANVVPACSSCNSSKHDDSLVLWLARRMSRKQPVQRQRRKSL